MAYAQICVLFSNLSMFLSSLSRPDAAGEELGGLGPTLKEGLSGTQNKELMQHLESVACAYMKIYIKQFSCIVQQNTKHVKKSAFSLGKVSLEATLSNCHHVCLSYVRNVTF